VRSHLRRQHLEGNVAAELRIGGAVHLAHPADADRSGDAVVGERPTDQEASFGNAFTISTCMVALTSASSASVNRGGIVARQPLGAPLLSELPCNGTDCLEAALEVELSEVLLTQHGPQLALQLAAQFLAGRSPTGWSAGVEISCRIYKPRRPRVAALPPGRAAPRGAAAVMARALRPTAGWGVPASWD
jgi:hypothetical protein